MANHKSAKKRIRQTIVRNLRNRYQHKTTRNLIKQLREIDNKKEAEKLLLEVSSKIDKLAKRNIIHNNKAANLKSKLQKRVNALEKSEEPKKASSKKTVAKKATPQKTVEKKAKPQKIVAKKATPKKTVAK